MILSRLSLLLMILVIVVGFFVLAYFFFFNPVKLEQGESLCLKYKAFYDREINKARIGSIAEVDSDRGAIELEILEIDSVYFLRIYEPIYSEVDFSKLVFSKPSKSFDLHFEKVEMYKLIRTCDQFLD